MVSSGDEGIRDEGILPLEHFLDSGGPDAVAAAIEMDPRAIIHPSLYRSTRRADRGARAAAAPVHAFGGAEYVQAAEAIVQPLLR